ncbi:TonB-dependent receptor [Pseudoxanthomonas kalamensis DSM 18571]|uniref:TonB-dependent receptor n=1 Tax=Pseudoxanthomonas kalamensis TaxID=289483 RepID=UPI001391186C|nr:TonB-dependent receptor [Pseudoxanthomonas kalamensis]KAF1711402.1 TonB-dependent receptor [Pseudoxanthomonas kalamensis DSM 18571]
MNLHQRELAIGLRRALLASCLLSAAGSALAQQATAEAQDDAATLDTVTVTAQSRQQELKDVPIAIQVVNGETIDRVAANDIGDLADFVPGLVVSDGSPTQPRYAIRGISVGDFGIGTDPPVGVYIDGVYSARTGGAMLAFNDIERIEVLKGPQGTLFGRNSAAGAVSLITNKPGSAFEANARLRFGEDGREYLSGLVNIPFGDRHALRFSALSNHSDGWLTDAGSGAKLNPEDSWATRAAWRSELGDATTLNLSWDHESINQKARPAIGLVALDPYPSVAPYPADPATYLNPLDAPVYNDVIGNEESRNFNGVTLQVTHDFSWGTLLSTTALRDFDTVNREDEDGSNRPNLYFDTANIESNRSYYQEFKFNGVAGSFDWVAGVSWFKEEADQTSDTRLLTDSLGTGMSNLQMLGGPIDAIALIDQILQGQGIPFTMLGHTWTESMINQGDAQALAAFGDVIWHVNDRLNLTFGLRLTHDRKEFSWYNGPREAETFDYTLAALDQAGFFALLQSMGLPVAAEMFQEDFVFAFGELEGVKVGKKDSWTDISPRFVIDYALSDDTMVFASLAKGYKAGGYNSVQPLSYFDNEEVWNAEFGIKTVFPEQKLSLNASTYYYIYKDRQSIYLDTSTAGSAVPRYLIDTSDLQAWGVDLDMHWRPVQGLDLNLSGAFIDSTYKDAMINGTDVSGDPTGEPYLSLSLGGSYTFNLGDAGDLSLSLLHAYRGKGRCNAESQTQGSCQSSPNFNVNEAQNRTDVRVQWTSADGVWGLGVYGNNVFDKQYVTGVNNISASVLGTPFASISAPRQLGAELSVSF